MKLFQKTSADVIICGAGLIGLVQTLLLCRQGVSVITIDAGHIKSYAASAAGKRTTAISYKSREIFMEAGIWPDLEPFACAIKNIDVLDGNSTVLLDLDIFENAKANSAQGFGWVIENFYIQKILLKHLCKYKNFSFVEGRKIHQFYYHDNKICAVTDNKKEYTANLLIGADGRNSKIRDLANIETEKFDYKQHAIVSVITHKNPHQYKAIEHFKSSGPFAILPMIDNGKGEYRSSIVWTEHAGSNTVMTMDKKTYLMALNSRFPDFYGDIIDTAERYSYPLNYIHAEAYYVTRIALIGDAAHGIHPVAGQGLNLGLRDVVALSKIIVQSKSNGEDFGSEHILQKYEDIRKKDNLLMSEFTHQLNKIFSNDFKSIKAGRKLGLKTFSLIKPLKKYLIRYAMGTGGYKT